MVELWVLQGKTHYKCSRHNWIYVDQQHYCSIIFLTFIKWISIRNKNCNENMLWMVVTYKICLLVTIQMKLVSNLEMYWVYSERIQYSLAWEQNGTYICHKTYMPLHGLVQSISKHWITQKQYNIISSFFCRHEVYFWCLIVWLHCSLKSPHKIFISLWKFVYTCKHVMQNY